MQLYARLLKVTRNNGAKHLGARVQKVWVMFKDQPIIVLCQLFLCVLQHPNPTVTACVVRWRGMI